MKKYSTLGELLLDYRKDNNISQINFATNINVDVRTVQRWEKNETLIKSEKENEIVFNTLLPHQLIRNLNSSNPIPTFYDFRIRKYSLTDLTNELPEAEWLKAGINKYSNRIRPINGETDLDFIRRDLQAHKHTPKTIDKRLICEAVKLLPELNIIITDDSNSYSGHCIVFPINLKTFEKLKNREISEEQITLEGLVNYKTQENPVFYCYDITGDCNDNIFYLAHHFLKFFDTFQQKNYVYCSFTIRYDSYLLNEQLGLKIAWQDKGEKDRLGLESHPRFYTGNFKKFLKKE